MLEMTSQRRQCPNFFMWRERRTNYACWIISQQRNAIVRENDNGHNKTEKVFTTLVVVVNEVVFLL